MYQFGNGTLPTPSPTPSPTPGSPVATKIPDGWTYKGCWIDNANGRAMIAQQPDDRRMTVPSCISACTAKGYGVAGMEYGVQCEFHEQQSLCTFDFVTGFCDQFLRNGAKNTSDSDCNMNCGGDSSSKCGAGNRLSVYSNSTEPVVSNPVPSTQKTNLTGSWQYLGCYRDAQASRALPWQIILNKNNTANNCITQCSNFGYQTGGMEYGNECVSPIHGQWQNS
jgi:hypothetical protein